MTSTATRTGSHADSRMAKAIDILRTASTWTPITRRSDGKRGYLVPSQSGSSAYRVALDGSFCDCRDFQDRGMTCKHSIAVSLHEAAKAAAVPTAAEVAEAMTELFGEVAA